MWPISAVFLSAAFEGVADGFERWCDRGHVLYVLEGALQFELKDGRSVTLKTGTSYQVSDFGDASHRSPTGQGAKLSIVD